MAVVPRSIITAGSGFLSARAASRLKRTAKAEGIQKKTLSGLTSKLALGSFWSSAGVEAGITYDDYRDRVPLQTYEDLAPCIERMKKGEGDVLCQGQCQLYAQTSGTTSGRTKFIPVTEGMLGHFRRTGLESLLWYCTRVRSTRVFRGRHLFLGGSTALTPIPESLPFEAYAGDLSGIAALNLPKWIEEYFFEPGGDVAQIADWPSKIAAIVERTSGVDISLLAGIPIWILVLSEAVRQGAGGAATLQEVWPNLECFVHGGMPVAPFLDELRGVLGPTVNFHEVYAASEGFIAAQDGHHSEGLRIMVDAGIFFEFVPMSEFDERRIPTLGQKAVPIWGVKTGVDYALVITTPAGLARYVIGDIVRFVSTQPARIVYVGRTALQLSAFGEHVSERDLSETLRSVCRRNGWTIVNFHVAPLFSGSVTGRMRGRHEWWVELKAGTALTPTGPIMAPELDAELKHLNPDYAAKRSTGSMDPPFVRLVMPGVFEQWMNHHGKWGGQNKMPRCRSDRLIADELGGALQFAKD
jgi:GH3 auxin-responsive promoter